MKICTTFKNQINLTMYSNKYYYLTNIVFIFLRAWQARQQQIRYLYSYIRLESKLTNIWHNFLFHYTVT
jgi:hypothetical protein